MLTFLTTLGLVIKPVQPPILVLLVESRHLCFAGLPLQRFVVVKFASFHHSTIAAARINHSRLTLVIIHRHIPTDCTACLSLMHHSLFAHRSSVGRHQRSAAARTHRS